MTSELLQTELRRRPVIRWIVWAGAGISLLGTFGCLAAREQQLVATPDFTSARVLLDARTAHAAELARTPPPELLPIGGSNAAKFSAASSWTDKFDETWQPDAPTGDWRYIVLHHSGAVRGSVESIDAEHRRRTDKAGNSWLGIGYHFVVGNGSDMPDGEIVPTFRWEQQLAGAHAGDQTYNDAGIGICVIGDCESTPPTDRQLQSLRRLVAALASRYRIAPAGVIGHGDVKATKCPGKHFPLAEIAQAAVARCDPPVAAASWLASAARPVGAPLESEAYNLLNTWNLP